MVKHVMIFVLMAGAIAFSQEKLPKSCFGEYIGEMEAYEVIKNEVELSVDKHNVRISIDENQIIYSSGTLTVKGSYDFIKQSKTEYLIKASFSNGKSLTYQMDFLWDKKEGTIKITGKNGEPDVELEKLD